MSKVILAQLTQVGLYGAIAACIGVLILVHELGHYFAARISRMQIEELSIGVGKKLLGFTKNGILYSIRLFPFFGYVKITGMGLLDEEQPEGFNSRPFLARAFTLAAGGIANMLFAAVLFGLLVFLYGRAVESSSAVDSVMHGKPAHAAGMRAGDRIVGIAGKRTTDVQTIRSEIEDRPGEPVDITVLRGRREHEFRVTPAAIDRIVLDEHGDVEEGEVGQIGILFHSVRERVGVWPALKSGCVRTAYEGVEIVTALWLAIRGYPVLRLMGPVGIVNELGQDARSGTTALPWVLDRIASICLVLGMLNLVIPCPGLDGGRLAFLFLMPVIQFVIRRKVDPKVEFWAHSAGICSLLLLMVFITVRDIANWH